MKHLVIVGNGFDLSLNLQTRFIDFVNNYLSKQDIGNSFLLNHIKQIGKDLLWIDMEKELKKLSKNLIDTNGEVATEVEDLANDFEILKQHLINYLNIENKKNLPSDSKSHELINSLAASKDVIIINFNYTDTLINVIQSVSMQHLINDKKVHYFHGNLKGDIILGIEDTNIHSDLSFFKKSIQKNYNKNSIRLTQKLKEAEIITIWGYSLGESDHTYYSDFFNELGKESVRLPLQKINIYHYKENGKRIINSNIDKLLKGRINSIKEREILQYYDISQNSIIYNFK